MDAFIGYHLLECLRKRGLITVVLSDLVPLKYPMHKSVLLLAAAERLLCFYPYLLRLRHRSSYFLYYGLVLNIPTLARRIRPV